MLKREVISQMISKQKPKNLDCSDIENLVQQYLDNVLDSEARCSFEEHLEYCLPCDKKIEFESRLRTLVKVKFQDTLSSDQIEDTLEQFFTKLNP